MNQLKVAQRVPAASGVHLSGCLRRFAAINLSRGGAVLALLFVRWICMIVKMTLSQRPLLEPDKTTENNVVTSV